jgi:hypothetical protein
MLSPDGCEVSTSQHLRPSPNFGEDALDPIPWRHPNLLGEMRNRERHGCRKVHKRSIIETGIAAGAPLPGPWTCLYKRPASAGGPARGLLFLTLGNHVGLRGLAGGAEGIRTSDLRSAGTRALDR